MTDANNGDKRMNPLHFGLGGGLRGIRGVAVFAGVWLNGLV